MRQTYLLPVLIFYFLVICTPTQSTNELDKKTYEGAQVWRVETTNKLFSEKLDNFTGIETWSESNLKGKLILDVFVSKDSINEAKELLKEEKLEYSISIPDLQKAINEENPSSEEILEFQNRDGRPITWRAYHRMNDIHKFLEYLQINNPDLVSTKVIGTSSQRRELKVVTVSNKNPNNKIIWVDAGIHAREWISPAVATYILNELVEEWDDLPEYMRNIDWHFLPITNPDGYEYTHDYDRLWRKNRAETPLPYCKGVDLNRNYGYKWGGKGVSKSPCSEIYGGSGPFSEPETRAIQDYVSGLRKNIDASLSFHSYGQYILYPWGYDSFVTEDEAELSRVGHEAAEVSIMLIYVYCIVHA